MYRRGFPLRGRRYPDLRHQLPLGKDGHENPGHGWRRIHRLELRQADARRAYPAFADADVTVLDALTYAGNLANLAPIADSPRYRFVEGDICDAELVAELMPQHDAVVHFAAESHVDRSITGAADFVRTNVLGTQVLLQAALDAGIDRFVHVSTDEVYGSIDEGPGPRIIPCCRTRRTRRPRPVPTCSPAPMPAPSGSMCASRDVRTTTGPTSSPRRSSPLFVTNLMDGANVPLYGEGLNVRDWLRRRSLQRHPDGA